MVQAGHAAATVFAERLSTAEQYAEILATTAVQRGLIGPREVPRIWDRHLLNCAAVQELVEPGARVVDVGSGAGLPGIPLAIVRPDLRITLLEPLLRRATFLEEVVVTLKLDITVVRGRAEDAATRDSLSDAAVVVSRAVAPLAKLMAWCLPLACIGGRVLAIKGASVGAEIERDGAAIVRMGGRGLRVRECRALPMAEPTTVVEVHRG